MNESHKHYDNQINRLMAYLSSPDDIKIQCYIDFNRVYSLNILILMKKCKENDARIT